MHVKTDESVVSAIERNGLRSLLKRPTNSLQDVGSQQHYSIATKK